MRNILLTVAGLTPQIITETVWALTQSRNPPFVPDQIVIVTTVQGRLQLQTEILGSGALAEMCTEYDIPLPERTVVVVQGRDGGDLPDIRDVEDNVALANRLTRLVRDLTADPATRLHASLAGGRKTMSFYLGYVMSLFGRPQDSLSHVLVSPEFEASRAFWYIPRQPVPVAGRGGVPLSTRDARIELAEIPFLRLRARVEEPLLNDPEPDFASIIESLQSALAAKPVELFDATCEIQADGSRFALPPQLYAMYRLLAETAAQRRRGCGPDGIGPRHAGWLNNDDFLTPEASGTSRFIEILTSLPSANPVKVADTLRTLNETDVDSRNRRFQPEARCREIRSSLNAILRKRVGDYLLFQRLAVAQQGRGPSRFGLTLKPEEIRIHRAPVR